MKVIQENLEHHIQEEEQQMFPKGQKVLGENVVERMTQDYARAEEQLVGNSVSMTT